MVNYITEQNRVENEQNEAGSLGQENENLNDVNIKNTNLIGSTANVIDIDEINGLDNGNLTNVNSNHEIANAVDEN